MSVVVPVFNGSRTVSQMVECLLKQRLTPHEIIIVDDGSTDDTLKVLQHFGAQITVLSQPNGGPASARNRGIRVATGDFIAMTDSDCLPDSDWLVSLLAGFDSPHVGGVGGIVKGVNRKLISAYVDAIRLLDPGKSAEGEVKHLVTANACFRRDALIKAGLFDERFRNAEDIELSRRLYDLGQQLKAVDDAVVLHYHKPTLQIFLKTICNYGEGTYLLGRVRPEYEWKGDIRKGLLASLLGVPLLSGRGRRYPPTRGWARAVAFPALDYLTTIAFSWGYMRGRRRVNKGELDFFDGV